MSNDGIVKILGLVEWDWFVSCTVAIRGASDVYLKKRMWALYRTIARDNRIRVQTIPIAYRIESGSDPLHRHFHFLIGSLKRTSQSDRFRTMHLWESILGRTNKGTCRVREYKAAHGLAAYLTKELNGSEVQGWISGNVELTTACILIARRNINMRYPLAV